ncbi:hypothetical protein [Sphingomonas sp. DT-204]|uniref:hypothetical protein n=1 Tax=Sphingomonas sp. DT-204 TaxID=3396166 RepID=UPI003F1D36EC
MPAVALRSITTALSIVNLILILRLGRRLKRQHRARMTQLLLISRRLPRQPRLQLVESSATAPPPSSPVDPTAGFRDPCR